MADGPLSGVRSKPHGSPHITCKVFMVAVCVLTCHGSFITLRSGQVNLRPASDSLDNGKAEKVSPSDSSSGERSLFFLRHTDGAYDSLTALRDVVVAHGGDVVALLPEYDTLLVAAPARPVLAALSESGGGKILTTEYDPALKRSPEVVAALEAAAPARRRRQLRRWLQERQQPGQLGQDWQWLPASAQRLRGDEDDGGGRTGDWRNLVAAGTADGGGQTDGSGWQSGSGGRVGGDGGGGVDLPVGSALRRLATWSMRKTRDGARQLAEEGGGDAASGENGENADDGVTPSGASPSSPSSPPYPPSPSASPPSTPQRAVSSNPAAPPELYGIVVHLVMYDSTGDGGGEAEPVEVAAAEVGTGDATAAAAAGHALSAVVGGWPAALAAALERVVPDDPCLPRLAADDEVLVSGGTASAPAGGTPWVRVFLCAEDIEDGVSWLSAQRQVIWISPDLGAAVVQNAAAGWILQTGGLSVQQYSNLTTAVLRPYWKSGIKGQDIIVGMADTGIDMSHCFFLDEKYGTARLRDELSGSPPGWALNDHRKVVQYVLASGSLSLFGDDAASSPGSGGIPGHGTHVAGSIAGSLLPPPPAVTAAASVAASSGGSATADRNGFADHAATGAAPLARLSVYDLSPPGAASMLLQDLTPLDKRLLQRHFDVGARITSDSWIVLGTTPGAFDDLYVAGFDTFAWRNPGFLSVVAAGNFGRNGGLATTLVSPATAKNVITVGATYNHPAAATQFGDEQLFPFRFQDASGALRSMAVWPTGGSTEAQWQALLQEGSSGSDGGAGSSDATAAGIRVVLASPLSACGDLPDLSAGGIPSFGGDPSGGATPGAPLTPYYAGAVVLVDLGQGNCTAAARAEWLARRGAAAAVFVWGEAGLVAGGGASAALKLTPAPTPAPAPVPAPTPTAEAAASPVSLVYTYVTRELGSRMMAALQNSSNSAFRMACITYPELAVGVDSVASFSGYGPLPDGRIKPDLVAPGAQVLSARAGALPNPDATRDSCSSETAYWVGTSMATPQVAGHLALMRQYFRDGYYPTGDKASPEAARFEPSGMLLKAAAVAGAASLQGGYAMSSGAVMGPAPDGYQGWGRLSLAGSLPLPGLTDPRVRLQVADMGFLERGDVVALPGLRATGTGPIIAALVWHDFPSAPIAGGRALLNDLDLRFSVNGGPPAATREDRVNNVERAEITGLRPGDRITFFVRGTGITHRLLTLPDAQLPQRWALAVSGHYRGVLLSPLNPSYDLPQRLPGFRAAASASVGGSSREFSVALDDGCVGFLGSTVSASDSICEDPDIFTFTELAAGDSATSGAVYTIGDTLLGGRCWTLGPEPTAYVTLTNCTATTNQRFAVFKNPYSDTESYQLVPVSYIKTPDATTTRMCLRLQPPPAQQALQQAAARAHGKEGSITRSGNSTTATNSSSVGANSTNGTNGTNSNNSNNSSSNGNSNGNSNGSSNGSSNSSSNNSSSSSTNGAIGVNGDYQVLSLAPCDFDDPRQAFQISTLPATLQAGAVPTGADSAHQSGQLPDGAAAADGVAQRRRWLPFLALLGAPVALAGALWVGYRWRRRAAAAAMAGEAESSAAGGGASDSGDFCGAGKRRHKASMDKTPLELSRLEDVESSGGSMTEANTATGMTKSTSTGMMGMNSMIKNLSTSTFTSTTTSSGMATSSTRTSTETGGMRTNTSTASGMSLSTTGTSTRTGSAAIDNQQQQSVDTAAIGTVVVGTAVGAVTAAAAPASPLPASSAATLLTAAAAELPPLPPGSVWGADEAAPPTAMPTAPVGSNSGADMQEQQQQQMPPPAALWEDPPSPPPPPSSPRGIGAALPQGNGGGGDSPSRAAFARSRSRSRFASGITRSSSRSLHATVSARDLRIQFGVASLSRSRSTAASVIEEGGGVQRQGSQAGWFQQSAME